MTDHSNEQLVRSLAEAVSAGDVARARALFDRHALWAVMGGLPNAATPLAADVFVAELLDQASKIFADGRMRVEVRRIIGQDGDLAAENVASGKLKDGSRYENEQLWVIEVRDGKISALREYMSGNHISAL